VLTVQRGRAYLGEVHFRGAHHPGPHPALIDVETFDGVQQLLQERGASHAKRATNSTDYLLSGLIVCRRCGSKSFGTAAHGRYARYRYYTCFHRHRYGTKACPAERIPADDLENTLIEELVETFTRRDRLELVIQKAIARLEASRPHLLADVAAATAEVRQIEESLERYFRAFEAGTMSELACAPRIQQLTDNLRSLRARHADLTAIRDDAPTAPDLIGLRSRIADTLGGEKEPPRRKALLQELVSHVTVHPHFVKPVFLGLLMSRPRWVRFPSIPAISPPDPFLKRPSKASLYSRPALGGPVSLVSGTWQAGARQRSRKRPRWSKRPQNRWGFRKPLGVPEGAVDGIGRMSRPRSGQQQREHQERQRRRGQAANARATLERKNLHPMPLDAVARLTSPTTPPLRGDPCAAYTRRWDRCQRGSRGLPLLSETVRYGPAATAAT